MLEMSMELLDPLRSHKGSNVLVDPSGWSFITVPQPRPTTVRFAALGVRLVLEVSKRAVPSQSQNRVPPLARVPDDPMTAANAVALALAELAGEIPWAEAFTYGPNWFEA
jgi:hypothetical protein